MKMKMFLLALPCSALLILGPSSPIAFADDLSGGQTIFIGGINFMVTPPGSGGETVNTLYTLYNPNEDATIVITEIRVIDTDGNPVELADPLPLLADLPPLNTADVEYNQLLRDPFPFPPPHSQIAGPLHMGKCK